MLLKTFICLMCSVTMALDICINNGTFLVKQEPKQLLLNPGETAIINCTVMSKELKVKYLNLRKRFTKLITIGTHSTEYMGKEKYTNRLTYSGQAPHFTLMLKNVTHDDSDLYICEAIIGGFVAMIGEGTYIFVGKGEVTKKENATEELNVNETLNSPKHRVQLYIIIIGITAGLFLLLVLFAFVRYFKMEKINTNHNTYVDMTQTLRRNTMQNNNNVYHRQ